MTLNVGDRVVVGSLPGIVRYYGTTSFATGEWVGIELSEAKGKNNGSVQSRVYFICEPKKGIFVRPDAVKLLTKRSPSSQSSHDGSWNSRPASSLGTRRKDANTFSSMRDDPIHLVKEAPTANLPRQNTQQQKSGWDDVRAKLQAKMGAMTREIETLQVQIRNADAAKLTLQLRLDELRDQLELSDLDKSLAEERYRMCLLEMEHVSSDSQNRSTVDPSNLQAIELERQVSSLRNALLQVRQIMEGKDDDYRHKLEALRLEITSLKSDKEISRDAESKLARLEAEVGHLKEQLESTMHVDSVVDSLTVKNLQLAEELDQTRATVADLETLKELTDQLVSNHQSVESDLENEVEQGRAVIDSQIQQLQELEQLNEKNERKIAEYQRRLEEVEATLKELRVSRVTHGSHDANNRTSQCAQNQLKDMKRKGLAQRIDFKHCQLELRELREIHTILSSESTIQPEIRNAVSMYSLLWKLAESFRFAGDIVHFELDTADDAQLTFDLSLIYCASHECCFLASQLRTALEVYDQQTLLKILQNTQMLSDIQFSLKKHVSDLPLQAFDEKALLSDVFRWKSELLKITTSFHYAPYYNRSLCRDEIELAVSYIHIAAWLASRDSSQSLLPNTIFSIEQLLKSLLPAAIDAYESFNSVENHVLEQLTQSRYTLFLSSASIFAVSQMFPNQC